MKRHILLAMRRNDGTRRARADKIAPSGFVRTAVASARQPKNVPGRKSKLLLVGRPTHRSSLRLKRSAHIVRLSCDASTSSTTNGFRDTPTLKAASRTKSKRWDNRRTCTQRAHRRTHRREKLKTMGRPDRAPPPTNNNLPTSEKKCSPARPSPTALRCQFAWTCPVGQHTRSPERGEGRGSSRSRHARPQQKSLGQPHRNDHSKLELGPEWGAASGGAQLRMHLSPKIPTFLCFFRALWARRLPLPNL